MFRNFVLQVYAAGCVVALAGSLANAQAPVIGESRPASRIGGYAGTQLQSIYRSGVGTGYSATSLNQNTLRNVQGYLPNGRLATGLSTRSSGPSNIGLSSGPASKPFSTYTPPPTTSPYLNLFREDIGSDDSLNYNTLVRPMLQQQEFNERIQRQSLEVARRLQSIAAQADYNIQGSESQVPTGHKTVFNYLGHYYPVSRPQR